VPSQPPASSAPPLPQTAPTPQLSRGVPVAVLIVLIVAWVAASLALADKSPKVALALLVAGVVAIIVWGRTVTVRKRLLADQAWQQHLAEIQAAQQAWQHAQALAAEQQQRVERQQSITHELAGCFNHATTRYTELPVLLKKANTLVIQAQTLFHTRTYSSFWQTIEDCCQMLQQYDQEVHTIQQDASEYATLTTRYAREWQLAAPPFPVTTEAVEYTAAAFRTVEALQTLMPHAQRDRDFALIWEQRRGTSTVPDVRKTLTRLKQDLDADLARLRLAIDVCTANRQRAIDEGADATQETFPTEEREPPDEVFWDTLAVFSDTRAFEALWQK